MSATELITIAIFAAVVIVQFLLCFKAKRLVLRLLPATALLAATSVFLVLTAITKGWDVIGYLLLTVYTALMLLSCGIVWGIFAIVKLIKKVSYENRKERS